MKNTEKTHDYYYSIRSDEGVTLEMSASLSRNDGNGKGNENVTWK